MDTVFFRSRKERKRNKGLFFEQPLIIQLRREDILEGNQLGPGSTFLFTATAPHPPPPPSPHPKRTLESHQFCHEVRNLIQLSIHNVLTSKMLNKPFPRRKAEEGNKKSNIFSVLKRVLNILKLLCMKMGSQSKSLSQCNDIFSKSSWLFPFLSLLLTIALFQRMEAINNKTEINDMRI